MNETRASERVRKVLQGYKERNGLSTAQLARAMDVDNQTCVRMLKGTSTGLDKCDAALNKIGMRIGVLRVK